VTALPSGPHPDLLRSLVREVVEEVLRDVLAGALGAGASAPGTPYRPAGPVPGASPMTGPVTALPSAPVRRIERGAVTESVVRQAAQDGVRLVLGRRAVLTPLARDLSRTLGVEVERRTDPEEH
jgi:hypothetical protein